MSRPLRIGIVGGSGWLGGAIAGALLKAGVVRARDLTLSYRSSRPDRLPGSTWTTDNQALVERSDVVVVSVRPADWPELSIDCRERLVISVMAGIRLDAIVARHGSERAVRALPSAAAEVAASCTPWIATPATGASDRATVRAILEACGSEDEVPSERDIDYLTGLSGSGPAFPALLAAAMARDAVAHGIPVDVARRAANAVLVGAGRLVERDGQPPEEVVKAFVDYRGTTAAGIEAMRAAGFDVAVAEGLAAAFARTAGMADSGRDKASTRSQEE
jgi:pyrroline-5-carboxylate reductase